MTAPIVIAEASLQALRRLQRLLSAQSIEARIVRPPEDDRGG